MADFDRDLQALRETLERRGETMLQAIKDAGSTDADILGRLALGGNK